MYGEVSEPKLEFVDHHKSQGLEEGDPFCVMGEDARVEHIRVRNDDIPFGADSLPCILGRISIIGESSNWFFNLVNQVLKLKQLVLRKRFSGKEV
jgi:hypothetical protein